MQISFRATAYSGTFESSLHNSDLLHCWACFRQCILNTECNFFSIEEECGLPSCPATLAAKNMELHASLQSFVSTLSKVGTHISLLASQSTSFIYVETMLMVLYTANQHLYVCLLNGMDRCIFIMFWSFGNIRLQLDEKISPNFCVAGWGRINSTCSIWLTVFYFPRIADGLANTDDK